MRSRSASVWINPRIYASYVKRNDRNKASNCVFKQDLCMLIQEKHAVLAPQGKIFRNIASLLCRNLFFLPSEDSLALQKKHQNLQNFPALPGWDEHVLNWWACAWSKTCAHAHPGGTPPPPPSIPGTTQCHGVRILSFLMIYGSEVKNIMDS